MFQVMIIKKVREDLVEMEAGPCATTPEDRRWGMEEAGWGNSIEKVTKVTNVSDDHRSTV
jgi:hypothetical protein